MTEILYDRLCLDIGQILPYSVNPAYGKIIDRVVYLSRQKEFAGSVDLSKENFLVLRGIQAYQKAIERWKEDQYKNND